MNEACVLFVLYGIADLRMNVLFVSDREVRLMFVFNLLSVTSDFEMYEKVRRKGS